MTDFGDDSGDIILRWFQDYLKKLGAKTKYFLDNVFPEMKNAAKQWFQEHFKSDPQAAADFADRTPMAIPISSKEAAEQFAAFARSQGVWAQAVTGENGEPMVGFYEEDMDKIAQCVREWERVNPEKYREWEDFAHAQQPENEQTQEAELDRSLPNGRDRSYMDEIRAKVEVARDGAVSEADFISRCEAQGLTVSRAADGELLFTHENGWFDVRGDTLGKEYTRDAFERGVGEKSEEMTQHAADEQERYIQSHDGGDIDTRTRVVESVTKPQPSRDGKQREKEYNLTTEAQDMRSASKALDNSNREEKSIGPQER